MHVDIEGQPSPRVTFRDGLKYRAHVARNTRYTKQPGLAIQNMIQLLRRITPVAQQVNDDPWINRAATCAHHEALQRSEPHRRIDTSASLYRAQRRSIAEMAHQQAWRRLSEHVRDATRCVLVADAMKSVAPNSL